MRNKRSHRSAFTLFEVLIALAVFMLAVTGLAVALDTALQAALEVRQRSFCRSELESRLAYCQANPPPLGAPRILEASQNHGVRVAESLAPYRVKNGKRLEVTGLKKLTITTKSGTQSDRAEILLNLP
ncbi:MAG: prepilin-type N-terminal cleavage/methylation domain-containing protein [Verrucomicrobia bacterium]|nr:prepilin-type N-terminal cleavage/methylation domain-containing protein [Verrucomicrobiota bacterium]